MTRNELIALGVGVAAIAVALTVDIPGGTKDQAGERVVEPSKVGLLPNNGKGYVVKVVIADGGVELRRAAAPGCMRRPVGAAVDTCMVVEGGKGVDRGAMNRFPADASVGAGCEPVACSVVAGEDPDISDDARVQEYRSTKDAGRK